MFLQNTLLEKIEDGQKLTDQELRYLELTSETLSIFLDRGDFQHACSMLDPSFVDFVEIEINQIETSIADGILKQYYTLRAKLKTSRTKYLRNRIQGERNKALSFSLNLSRDLGTKPSIEKGRTRHKIYTSQIEKSLNNKDKKIVFKHYIRPRGVSQEFLDRNYRGVELCQSALHEGMSKKQFMHQNHPPSKIIKDPWKGFKKGSVEKEYIIARSKQEQAYRLFNKDIKEIHDKKPFKKFYSGGPINRIQMEKVTGA